MDSEDPKKQEIMQILGQCYDPEIPKVSVVDLGLIYDVSIDEAKVDVKMTLTTPGCGMAKMMVDQIKMMISDLPWVKNSSVEIVWEPPWHPDRMNEKAKKLLGFD